MPPTEIAHAEPLDVTELGALAPFEPPNVVPGPEDATGNGRPRWARPALAFLLVATAASYLYNLTASGFGNSFYAAAVEAGSKSWKAMLFGSLDPSNFITVDKPPASLWVMDLSARLFGFSTWSVMVPNVLEGVLAVALLYATVRRVSNEAAGLAAGTMLAATPVAALMFRFDNPDSFLTLLLVAAAYCLTRAIERAGTRWLVAVGALLGFAFLTKMMQGLVVVPAFGLAYLVAAPTTLRRRIVQLLSSGVALVAASGWWLAIVTLVPASDRPFIDGSPDNSIWNLIFDYNGFGRIVSSGAGGMNFSGEPGVFRLFNDLMGGQASWLLPAALLGLVGIFVARRHAPRTDAVRAAAIVWGGWLLVTGAVFSYGQGVIHTYYTVALAPAIAALVAIGGHQLWLARQHLWARLAAAAVLVVTSVWAFVLLDRTPAWYPELRWLVLVAGLVAAVGVLVVGRSSRRTALGLLAVLAGAGALAGPVAYSADTIASAHTGSIPTAGPSSGATTLGPGGGGGPAQVGGAGAHGLGGLPGGAAAASPFGRAGSAGGPVRSSTGAAGAPPSRGRGTLGGAAAGHTGTGRRSGSGLVGAPAGGRAGGGTGAVNAKLARFLESEASSYRWIVAVDGSQTAASIELATSGDPVMAIGGFNGNGGNLSLRAFEGYVKDGDIHYYIAGDSGGGGGGGPGGGSGSSSAAITQWVESHFHSVTVDGETVYVLTSATS
jgi:4-amino-4-deoxy-L-arabinose transferase-like glycosyltransferase